MNKKTPTFLLIPLLLALAACSSLNLTGSQAQGAPAAGSAPGLTNQPVENKLAIGTLKLEGSENAVTQQQAKDLLPLWKAVKSLGSSSTASAEEINALYSQIQETMTAGQVEAIKAMALTPEDTQALMKQYNIQAPQPGNFPTLSPDQLATRQASRSSSQAGGQGSAQSGGGPGFDFGGPPPDGGVTGPGGGFAGGPQAGSQNGASAPGAARTPVPGPAGRGMRSGMNNLFLDPLIQLLEQRAGA